MIAASQKFAFAITTTLKFLLFSWMIVVAAIIGAQQNFNEGFLVGFIPFFWWCRRSWKISPITSIRPSVSAGIFGPWPPFVILNFLTFAISCVCILAFLFTINEVRFQPKLAWRFGLILLPAAYWWRVSLGLTKLTNNTAL